MSRDDRRAAGLLLGLGLLLFGPTIPFAGLHTDDFGVHRLFSGPWSSVWHMFLTYVPGRNLDIAYEAALHALLGSEPFGLHLAGLAFDLLNVVLFYFLMRGLGAPIRWAFAAGAFFLVYPNHGESHFWTFAIAQNLIPVTLVFCAALLLRRDEAPRFWPALLLFFLALFDYDQVFILWVPLLLIALLPWRPGRLRRAGAFAASCLAADVAHVLFRHLAKESGGGRPVITLGHVWPNIRFAARSSLIPMVKLPRLEFLSIGPLGPAAAIALCAAAAAALALVARRLPDERDEASAWRLVLIGFCWTACAYFPNLFWYISGRHNYLPSAGFLMAAAGAGMLVWARLGAAPRRAAAVAGALAFGLAAAFDFAEGRAWAASSRLLDGLAAEARRGPAADNVFVLGAPASFGPAPALAGPGEADFAAAGDDGQLPFASIAPAASRRGLFAGCESDLLGDAGWFWRSAEGARVLVYEGGRFSRAGRLIVEPAGLPPETIDLGEGPATARLSAPLWLAAARLVPASGEGPALSSATLALAGEGAADLTLSWTPSGGKDFGFVLTIDDASGRLFEARQRPKARRETLWPAYDDLLPPGSWPEGKAARERWRLRLSRAPVGRVTARLRLFERTERGPWRPRAELSALL